MPWEVVPRLINQKMPLDDWMRWAEPESAGRDVSLHAFLKAQGLSDPAIRLANDTSPAYGTSSWDISALMLEWNAGFLRNQIEIGPTQFAVKGGNANLPIALAKLLKGDLLTGKPVVGIASEADAATVTCADGSQHRARRVICALPLGTMRRIAFAPGLEGAQAQAVATVPYQPLTNLFLAVSRPFWEDDGLSPGMWSNGPLGWVMPQYFGEKAGEVTGLLVQGLSDPAIRLANDTSPAYGTSSWDISAPCARPRKARCARSTCTPGVRSCSRPGPGPISCPARSATCTPRSPGRRGASTSAASTPRSARAGWSARSKARNARRARFCLDRAAVEWFTQRRREEREAQRWCAVGEAASSPERTFCRTVDG
jgi:hypothetical protein